MGRWRGSALVSGEEGAGDGRQRQMGHSLEPSPAKRRSGSKQK
jgi:hypothetical protein